MEYCQDRYATVQYNRKQGNGKKKLEVKIVKDRSTDAETIRYGNRSDEIGSCRSSLWDTWGKGWKMEEGRVLGW